MDAVTVACVPKRTAPSAMAATPRYISVSRRTDIPRFFVNDFFKAWLAGEVTYDGGYGRSHTVSLRPGDVLGYIFWSKDFEPLLRHPLFEKLIATSNAVFHCTVNDDQELEPRVAPLESRLKTLRDLCAEVGPERVFWRFDPICKYVDTYGRVVSNEQGFFRILPHVKSAGIKHCFFSFMSMYRKLNNRGLRFQEFSGEEKRSMCRKMLHACSRAGMILYNCCNSEVVRFEPGILQAHCIDNDILQATDRFNVHRPLVAKPTRKGCGCHESRDIGSYSQKCPHGCLYCYANPL